MATEKLHITLELTDDFFRDLADMALDYAEVFYEDVMTQAGVSLENTQRRLANDPDFRANIGAELRAALLDTDMIELIEEATAATVLESDPDHWYNELVDQLADRLNDLETQAELQIEADPEKLAHRINTAKQTLTDLGYTVLDPCDTD